MTSRPGEPLESPHLQAEGSHCKSPLPALRLTAHGQWVVATAIAGAGVTVTTVHPAILKESVSHSTRCGLACRFSWEERFCRTSKEVYDEL